MGILPRFPTIKQVYFTTQATIEVINTRWIEIENYGLQNGIAVKRVLTPSASARFQMGTYKSDNPLDKTPLRNFIYQSWRNTWDI